MSQSRILSFFTAVPEAAEEAGTDSEGEEEPDAAVDYDAV